MLHRSSLPALTISSTLALLSTFACAQSESDASILRQLGEERITIDLSSVALLPAVYRIIGQLSLPLPIVWPEEFSAAGAGKVSISVKDQPLGDVLKQVLSSQELDFVVRDGTLHIGRARDPNCAEREATEQRFLAKGITVGMTIAKPDRCERRALVKSSSASQGAIVAEGAKVDPEVTVGLIQRHGVVFLFEGRCFESRSTSDPGADTYTDQSPDEAGGASALTPSPEDRAAFDSLRIKLFGTVMDPDDPRNSVAIIDGADIHEGSTLHGGQVEVISIQSTSMTVRFRGFDWRIESGSK